MSLLFTFVSEIIGFELKNLKRKNYFGETR